jgi:hypothetical protein
MRTFVLEAPAVRKQFGTEKHRIWGRKARDLGPKSTEYGGRKTRYKWRKNLGPKDLGPHFALPSFANCSQMRDESRPCPRRFVPNCGTKFIAKQFFAGRDSGRRPIWLVKLCATIYATMQPRAISRLTAVGYVLFKITYLVLAICERSMIDLRLKQDIAWQEGKVPRVCFRLTQCYWKPFELKRRRVDA